MTARLISSIRIEKLFGLYTYDVPGIGELSNAAILYGDNGVGKSTLLRLVFHLLSAADNRGHRTALYNAKFSRLEVNLSTGVKLTAQSSGEESKKLLVLEIEDNNKKIAGWDYRPKDQERHFESESFIIDIDDEGNQRVRRRARSTQKRDGDNVPRNEYIYLGELNKRVPTLFILNADRRLDSDSVPDPSDEVELRRIMQYGEPRRINELVSRSREIALSQALGTASRWISQKAVLGTNKGSMNVHSVYGDVLRRIVSPSSFRNESGVQGTATDLVKQLSYIDTKTSEHARYELATHLPTIDFRKALSGRSKQKNELAAELLKPYIKSLEGRLEAVEPIYQLTDKFVTLVNNLLRDKTISFKLSQGFNIQNSLGEKLTPAQLSSGEQQLLLLFCHVLTARDAPTIFMIDEPEISLNIKWQRQLVQALLDITSNANIQFIFASHSMELLAQHRNRVVKLASIE